MLSKRLISLLLALILIALPVNASGQTLISPDEIMDQQAAYNTTLVQRGSFTREYNITAVEYYPQQEILSLDADGAYFAEFLVKEGQEVQKGDVLAQFTVESSSVELERLNREILLLQEETTQGISQRNETIETLKNTSATGLEKEKNETLLRKYNAELGHYEYLQQRKMDALTQERDAEQEKLNGYVLTAPADGKVTAFAKVKAGDPVSAGQTLMTLIHTDVKQLRVHNPSCDLRYNMTVKVAIERPGGAIILTGRVVAADGAIALEKRTGYAYIAVETEESFAEAKVTVETVHLDNVLLVERGVVASENSKYFVTKLVDGMQQKRYVGFGLNGTEYTWVISGVAEGDLLLAN